MYAWFYKIQCVQDYIDSTEVIWLSQSKCIENFYRVFFTNENIDIAR